MKGKRSIKLPNHILSVELGAEIIFGVGEIDRFCDRFGEFYFGLLNQGKSILPPVSLGPICKANHLGYDQKSSDAPKLKLRAELDRQANIIIISPTFVYIDDNAIDIQHTTNLFLELFGEYGVFDSNFNLLCQNTADCIPDFNVNVPIRVLEWEILPYGHVTWQRLKEHLLSVMQNASYEQCLLYQRFTLLYSHGPDFIAVGQSSFRGYVAFAFSSAGFYVLENMFLGNATYVFESDWESLSRLPKAEILSLGLCADRIVHNRTWDDRMKRWLDKLKSV